MYRYTLGKSFAELRDRFQGQFEPSVCVKVVSAHRYAVTLSEVMKNIASWNLMLIPWIIYINKLGISSVGVGSNPPSELSRPVIAVNKFVLAFKVRDGRLRLFPGEHHRQVARR